MSKKFDAWQSALLHKKFIIWAIIVDVWSIASPDTAP
jgi:hypothetical protein